MTGCWWWEDLLDADEVSALLARAEWVASGGAPHVSKQRLQLEPEVNAGKGGGGHVCGLSAKDEPSRFLRQRIRGPMRATRRYWT